MRHNRFFLILITSMLIPGGRLSAQQPKPGPTKEDRIAEHQARIQKIIEDSQKRRQQSASRKLQETEAQPQLETKSAQRQETGGASTDTTATGSTTKIGAAAEEAPAAQERERIEGWRAYWNFYETPWDDQKSNVIRGEEQEYNDEVIRIRWLLGGDIKGTTQEDWTTRTVTYQWAGMTGADIVMELPNERGSLLLRNGPHCVELEYLAYGNSEVALNQWTQRNNLHAATGVAAPRSSADTRTQESPIPHVSQGDALSLPSIRLIVTPDFQQVVNGWVISMTSGTVFAQEVGTTNSVKIGSVAGDGRSVGPMTLNIDYMDNVTSAAKIAVSNAHYPRTLFATDEGKDVQQVIEERTGSEYSKLEALNALAEVYGFQINWEDDAARQLAEKQAAPQPGTTSDSPIAVLRRIESILGSDFASAAKGEKTLWIGLSDEYRANQEIPRLAERLQTEFKLETRLYLVNRIAASQAMAVIERDMLGCYAIAKPATSDVTSDTLKAQGAYWAIVKRPLSEEKEIREGLAKRPDLKNAVVCESIDNGGIVRRGGKYAEGGETVVVTAAPETHARIAAWLKLTEAEVKEVNMGAASDEPVPERRRLQVVLLEGGKAGTTATVAEADGTSATYSSEVPGQFGMTPADLKVLGFDGAIVAGRGVVDLVAQPGKMGESTLKLGGRFPVTLQYQQEREPYLMIAASLKGDGGGPDPLAENTMMLEKGKPAFLGVTNLSGAVIVAVTWLGTE